MNATHYRNMSDEELLDVLDDAKHLSPVIGELCKRLELKAVSITDANHRVECPVCQASLEADYDEANTMFTLKVEK